MQQRIAIVMSVNGQPFEGTASVRKLLSDFLREDVT